MSIECVLFIVCFGYLFWHNVFIGLFGVLLFVLAQNILISFHTLNYIHRYHTGVYQLIKEKGSIPFETCQPYLACSAESQEGFCPHIDTTCTAVNTCRTCSGFSDAGGQCVELDYWPNATVAEYGEVGNDSIFDMFSDPKEKAHKIRAEIYARGPVATTINATPLRDYAGGILDDPTASTSTNHIVSIVGFGKDAATGKDYWIIRNSWGEYW